MPPSDDTQDLIAAAGAAEAATTSSSSVVIMETITTASTQSSSSLNVSLHDQLSSVFEAKMTSTDLEEETQNSEMISTASETSSSCGSDVVEKEPEQQQETETEQSVKEENVDDSTQDEPPTEASQEENTTQSQAEETADESSESQALTTETPENSTNEKQEQTEEGEVETQDGPLSVLRRGAVAAVGGTMVGVGLVMIPLPTPFGAVIASSGLAVLGTEFKEAKDMNDKLIDGAKKTVNSAREKIVKSIESMEAEDFDADKDSEEQPPTINKTMGLDESGNVVAVTKETNADGDAAETTASDPVNKVALSKSSHNEDNAEESDAAPKWLLMNPTEQKRQERLAREKYRRENQTSFEQTKEYFTKKTGKFLSKNLLPLLKKDEKEEEGVESNANATSDSTKDATADAASKDNESDSNHGSEDGYVLVPADSSELKPSDAPPSL